MQRAENFHYCFCTEGEMCNLNYVGPTRLPPPTTTEKYKGKFSCYFGISKVFLVGIPAIHHWLPSYVNV